MVARVARLLLLLLLLLLLAVTTERLRLRCSLRTVALADGLLTEALADLTGLRTLRAKVERAVLLLLVVGRRIVLLLQGLEVWRDLLVALAVAAIKSRVSHQSNAQPWFVFAPAVVAVTLRVPVVHHVRVGGLLTRHLLLLLGLLLLSAGRLSAGRSRSVRSRRGGVIGARSRRRSLVRVALAVLVVEALWKTM